MSTKPSSDLYLIFSNLAMVPAIYLSVLLVLYPEAALLTAIGVVSGIYHMCQTGFFCVYNSNIDDEEKFVLLQYSDEFFVNTGLLWFILYTLEIPINLKITFVFLSQIFFLLFVLSGKHYAFIVIAIILLFFILLSIIYLSLFRRILRFALLPSLIALVLLISGFIVFFFGGDPGDKHYTALHGTWHILLMIAIFFVLYIKYGDYIILISDEGIRFFYKQKKSVL